MVEGRILFDCILKVFFAAKVPTTGVLFPRARCSAVCRYSTASTVSRSYRYSTMGGNAAERAMFALWKKIN
jgi:hypothetical protein